MWHKNEHVVAKQLFSCGCSVFWEGNCIGNKKLSWKGNFAKLITKNLKFSQTNLLKNKIADEALIAVPEAQVDTYRPSKEIARKKTFIPEKNAEKSLM